MIRRLAKVSEYPVITHCKLGRLVSRSRRIVGIATFRIVVSSATIRTALITIASVNHRRGSDRGGAAAAITAFVGRALRARSRRRRAAATEAELRDGLERFHRAVECAFRSEHTR